MSQHESSHHVDLDAPSLEEIPTRTVEPALTDEEVSELAGVKLDSQHYDEDLLFGRVNDSGPIRLEKPNGEPLAVYLPNAMPPSATNSAYSALRPAAMKGSVNRGVATGKNSRQKRIKEDGSVSDTNQVKPEMEPNTGLAGYFDRYPRNPYCRQTAYNINQPEKFAQATPMFQYASKAMEQFVPDRYANQKRRADETVDEWLISETPFTTVTVNLNWQTAAHTDSGDLPEGFGVMAVCSNGDYDGAYYIQPQYRTAFDLRSGDVILSDVHEWHGNGPFHSSRGYYERLSVVMYYRKDMLECGTSDEERERAKRLRDLGDTGEMGNHGPDPHQRDYSSGEMSEPDSEE